MAEQTNYAPWGTRARMRLMAIVGPIAGLGLLIAGVVMLIDDARGGVVLSIVGGLLTLLWAVMLPLARKAGKV